MSRRIRLRRLLIALACLLVLAAAGVVGYLASSDLWPERVRQETERRLSRALRTPVQIGHARLVVGLGLHFVAEDVALWPAAEGEPTLWIERANASVRPLSLLRGRFRLHRLRLTGARLRVERGADGGWNLASLGRRDAPGEPRVPHPEELLKPLIALENFARRLFGGPDFTDELEVRESTIAFRDASGPNATPVALSLRGVDGALRRGRLLGDTRLSLGGQLFDAAGDRGRLDWQGHRSRDGSIRLEMATRELEMQAVGSYLQALFPDCRVTGRLSGTARFETPAPGSGHLAMELLAENLEALLRPQDADRYGPVSADRAEARLALSISPQSVELEGAEVSGGRVAVRVEGTLARPLQPESEARLALSFRNLDFARARSLLGWLPRAERDTLAAALEPVEAGRLVRFEASGSTRLEGWEQLLRGRTLELPRGFAGSVEVADGALRVGESDRIDGLRGRASFARDGLRVENAQARLNGVALPALRLGLDGVSHLFASQAERRQLASGALPLPGLGALWQAFQSGDEDDAPPPPVRTALALEIDHLEHPMFLSPFEDVRASIVRAERGIHIVVGEGTWAGVPVRAEADWLFEPSEQVHVHVTAEAPRPRELEPEARTEWASGRFSLGALRAGAWRQSAARGRFSARAGEIFFRDVAIDLEDGRLSGMLALDLAEPDAVPFETSFALADGDVRTVMQLFHLGDDLVTGRVDLAGSFDGWLQPDVPLLNDLSGLLSIEARDGIVNRGIPPLLAIALASEAFNPLARRDVVRYAKLDTVLEFGDGSLRTQGLGLDGPDLRVFAHGDMALTRPPNEIEAEVVLFLFRQLDRAIGKIPLLNVLLLDSDQNLQAAYYELSGPWEKPEARLVPLRSLAAGPATNVLTGVPRFLLKSLEAIESMLGVSDPSDPEAPYHERAGGPRRS